MRRQPRSTHTHTVVPYTALFQSEGKPKKPVWPKDYKVPGYLEDRLVLPLLTEAVAALHDGVVEDADLLDAGVIFGTGFAPFRGGPTQYIRETGVDTVLQRLPAPQAKYVHRFATRPGSDSRAPPGRRTTDTQTTTPTPVTNPRHSHHQAGPTE